MASGLEGRPSGLQTDSYANGRIRRLSAVGQGLLRTDIRLNDGVVSIVVNSNVAEAITGSFGYILVWNRSRDIVKSFVGIRRDPKDIRYSFHGNGEQIGSATGDNFDLALANSLGITDAISASLSRGSVVQDRVVSYIQKEVRNQ